MMDNDDSKPHTNVQNIFLHRGRGGNFLGINQILRWSDKALEATSHSSQLNNIWTLNNMPGMLSIQHSPVVIRDTPITDWQWRVSTKLLEISLVYRCQSRHEGQWSGLDVINRTASNVIAGSFEAMARLEWNVIDLYKYENCRECFGESRNKLGMVQI